MPSIKHWAYPWAAGGSKAPAHGLSRSASKGSGGGGVRTVSTISCTAGAPGSTDALRPCSFWPSPRTRNCAREDLWSRVGNGDAIPTTELVYVDKASTAVDDRGRTVWSDSNKDKDLKRFYEFNDLNPFWLLHYAVTAECVVQLFLWNSHPWRHVLRTLDRFTGRLINMQEMPRAEGNRYWCVHDMVCVDLV